VALASACAGAPRPQPEVRPEAPAAAFSLQSVQFADVPGWAETDAAPALVAFRRSCATRRLNAPERPLSTSAQYGGVTGDWSAACNAAEYVGLGAERAFFESYFSPALVRGPGEAKLTAYFEPIVQASRTPLPNFSSPLLRRPHDMVTVDVAAFAEAYDNEALRGAPRRLTGQLDGAEVRPYPKREDISPAPGQAFAYAHPVDLYNLQIQGSGRLAFADGTQSRAAYAAQNGYRWNSALGALRNSGELQGGATWANFKAWVDARGQEAGRAALNADPSYVFFEEERIDDPAIGPRGAAGANLTPMGSIAVDPAFHPYGAVVFVDGEYGGAPFRRLLVAQDTGGAIRRGPLRGDVFFGSGPEAGLAAERMNAPARWWTLLPRGIPVASAEGAATG
jgi:membrane-bound lytic murein transglycosylase A